jgi:KaiC/GvpD/RAD55 family RecA-like ATPase
MIDFSTEVLNRSTESQQNSQKKLETSRFKILSLADLSHMPDPEWLISGILPKGGIVEMHGMPATGKSFIALDMALHVATGSSWHGHSTEQGSVLYVAAEGATGYKRRIEAWESAHGIVDIDSLYFVASGVQLHEDEEVEGLLDTVQRVGVDVSLVIFDTLARCFVGADENSSAAMGSLLEGTARIGNELGATTLLVHHTRKDGSTERGSIALRGGVDVMMAVERKKATNILTLSNLKMKDAPDFEDKSFQLASVADSCVIESVRTTSEKTPKRAATETKQDKCAAVLPPEGATHSEWLRLVEENDICSEATFNRYLTPLQSQGVVEQGTDGVYRRSVRV